MAGTEPITDQARDFLDAQQQLLDRFGVAGRSVYLDVDAVSGPVHALVSGSGPPVVLVPGFGDPAALWIPLIASLSGFTCYAVDRPCFGLSGSAVHTTKGLRTLAITFLEQVLDAIGIARAAIIANSMGSQWTIWLALDRPERVSAMVHVGCPAFILNTSAPLPMRLLSVRPIGGLLMKLSPPSPQQVHKFARMVGEDLSGSPEVTALLVAAQKMPTMQPAVLDLLGAALRLRGPHPGLTIQPDQLARIRQPVTLIWGARDAFGGLDVARAVAEIIPNAQLHVIEGGGHIPWVQQPEAVAAAAQPFLRRHAQVN